MATGYDDAGHRGLAGPGRSRLEIKKSQFLGWVEPVTTARAAAAVLAARRKAHYDARHHCAASILGPQGDQQRSNDDGEPAGSAGAPMLAALRQAQVSDVVAVVSRYFGGVKLGFGPLTRAYAQAVREALADAPQVVWRPVARLAARAPHATAGDFEHALRRWLAARGGHLDEVAHDAEAVALTMAVELDDAAAGADFLAGWAARGVSWTALGPARRARPAGP
ncbi:MAG: YigZ family protein [Propionibacteriaceae bacterium]|jgi:uncharacterized YigZ family protein|nr:YigZ family protein [Propionibacteriaceae bacterium]